jgi:nitrate reductase gamma subunit
MDLLEFARGPALQVASIIFIAGLIWRLIHLVLIPKKVDMSEARAAGERAGAVRTIFSRFLHHGEFRARTANSSALAYTMHLGLAVVIFGSAPHIFFIESLTGLSWPALPNVAIHVAAALTLAALIGSLIRRRTHPVLRLLSNFDDYFTWLVTVAPIVTGLLAVAHLGGRYETLLAIHLLSFSVFLVWFPFGKLMHSFIVIGSRYTTGLTFTRRGAKV